MRETPEQRSRIMRAVKPEHTGPEMVVRRMVHRMGYRYRLHRKDLPGKPDLAFPRLKKALFVHGCFWHGHDCARGARAPKNNAAYWRAKITRNRARDQRNMAALGALNWRVAVVWECELRDPDRVRGRLKAFLGERGVVVQKAGV